MTEKQLIEKGEEVESCEYPRIKLSWLIESVIELKLLAMHPNQSLSRDKLYNRLSHLEHMLVDLKDVNIKLERDWWEE